MADTNVKVEKAKDIGLKILQKMEGQKVSQFTFRRKDQIINLAEKNQAKINKETLHISPELLFQRYIVAANNLDNKEQIFMHELCPHPAALFDEDGMMRQTNKSVLADILLAEYPNTDSIILPDIQYVIDGGSLLQKITWPCGMTYDQLAKMYVDYVKRKYNQSTIIVFDGYIRKWSIN